MLFLRAAILIIILTGSFLLKDPNPAHAGKNIAVLELFTALGCADTIPADQNFNALVNTDRTNLIAFSCHTTLFDESTPDPHSQAFCDYRYDRYADTALSSAAGTPQMVLNGRFQTSGEEKHIVRDALLMAHSIDNIEHIQLGLSSEHLNITLPEMRFERPVDIWLFAYNKRDQNQNFDDLVSKNPRPYLNIATHAKKLLEWDGHYRNLDIELSMFPAEGYAILAQYADHSDIIAAGKVEKESTLPSSTSNQE